MSRYDDDSREHPGDTQAEGKSPAHGRCRVRRELQEMFLALVDCGERPEEIVIGLSDLVHAFLSEEHRFWPCLHQVDTPRREG
jgi:hypothetical protein